MGNDCTAFLKWALPRLGYRWAGFKKVRGQVCKRIRQRIRELELDGFGSYRSWLDDHRDEWDTLDGMTHISISKFFRDRKQWELLQAELLPGRARLAQEEGRPLRCWSIGCASGEEPYSLAILWKHTISTEYPGLTLDLVATDADEHMLRRARRACYTESSVREVPPAWKEAAFVRKKGNDEPYCLKDAYTRMVDLRMQNIRKEMPDGRFDLVFCKNVVAMYFEKEQAGAIFRNIADKMHPGAILLLGNHEKIPLELVPTLQLIDKGKRIYRKA